MARGVANKNAMRIDLARGRKLKLHRTIQLLREQSDAEDADEFARRIRDHLLDADFDATLRLRKSGVELRPVQIAP